MPRRLLGALAALLLAPATAGAVTPSVSVRSIAPGCQPKAAYGVPVTAGLPALPAGPHTYVIATGDATPCAEVEVTTTASDRSTRLRWTETPGAGTYRIYRDGETLATGVSCCEYVDGTATTTPGTPPEVAALSGRAGSTPDLTVAEDFTYDAPADTLATDVLRLPVGVFLTGAVAGEALAVIDGDLAPGTIAPTDDPGRLMLTLRPEGADPIELTMTVTRRDDGSTEVSTPVGLRLDRLTRTFYGTTFPTSCAAKSVLVDADGGHASAPLQATDCAALAFAPAITLGLDATGQSGPGGRPTLTATVTQPPGQAAARAVAITLPEGVTTPVGTSATGTSPFAPGPAILPVTAGSTPAGRTVLTLDGLPETPLTDLRFATALTNAKDLCSGLAAADATFVGHNTVTAAARPALALTGAPATCSDPPDEDPPAEPLPARPRIAVALRGVRRVRPRLALTVRAGNAFQGSNPRRIKLRLPTGLRLTRRSRSRMAVSVNGAPTSSVDVTRHLLTVRAGTAARTVTIVAQPGAITEANRLRRRTQLSFRLAVLTSSGRTYRVSKRVTSRS